MTGATYGRVRGRATKDLHRRRRSVAALIGASAAAPLNIPPALAVDGTSATLAARPE